MAKYFSAFVRLAVIAPYAMSKYGNDCFRDATFVSFAKDFAIFDCEVWKQDSQSVQKKAALFVLNAIKYWIAEDSVLLLSQLRSLEISGNIIPHHNCYLRSLKTG